MSVKSLDISGIGSITIQKRRGSRSIRIRLSQNGEVKITQPAWLPFKAGEEFALKHREWIEKHRHATQPIQNGQPIGKQHRIVFQRANGSTITSRVDDIDISVFVPAGRSIDESAVQTTAVKAAKRALVSESRLLSERLRSLADLHDFSYKECTFRFMKSKWGSCRSDHRITLNYRLLDLPDELIDYVLVHELAHTKNLNHSPKFWALVESMLPDFKERRKAIKKVVLPW